jgi:hypothetical protein
MHASIKFSGLQMQTLAVGCGAGFSGDRVDAAMPVVKTLIKRGGPAAIMFENLAERTLAHQHLIRRANPSLGYEPLLDLELRPILADCFKHQIPIIGNFGAANPHGAAQLILQLAEELGLPKPRIAVVLGDDLSTAKGKLLVKQHLPSGFDDLKFVCANAYLGAFEIAQALQQGAQIVVTGRVADPSLLLGPAIAHYNWSKTDWDALAGATMAGHLLECGAQVSGGYFADPGKKDVPGLEDVGFPIAEIFSDGSCVISKADHTGGLVDCRTVKEQLLYEVHDPAAYITPDVVADITQAQVAQVGPDRVSLTGVKGHPRTDTLKVLAYFDGGWLGEGEISYAGPNAEARARLAMAVMQKRMGLKMQLRFDLIGISSILGDDHGLMLEAINHSNAADVRLRVAAKDESMANIDLLLRELTALWTGGPAGGGGVRVSKRQRLSNLACLIPRAQIPASVEFV